MRKVFFAINDITNDLITEINGSQLESAITCLGYICSDDPQTTPTGNFWIEKDTAGYPVFCTNVPLFQDIVLTMQNGQEVYTAHSLDFIQDHPIHRPK